MGLLPKALSLVKTTSVVATSVVLAAWVLPSASLAGPNANGSLILHAHPDIALCYDGPALCEYIETYETEPLLRCEDALTNLAYSDNILGSWSVYAAFPEGAAPRLAGATFGVEYDDSAIFLSDLEACADFELPTGGWPSPGEGTAVVWATAQTDILHRIYAFAGYEYYGFDISFDLVPHPTQGANFADDEVPSNLDPIVGLGSLGFNGNPGSLPCPVSDPLGACCFCPTAECELLSEVECGEAGGAWFGAGTDCDGIDCDCNPPGACCLAPDLCELRTEGECADAGGVYQGDDTTCDPNPCVGGACCFEDESCEVLLAYDCGQAGGVYQGDEVPCDPDPCSVTPALESSWGGIKARYR